LRHKHEEPLRQAKLSAGFGLRKKTVAGIGYNRRNAPILAVRGTAMEPSASTQSDRSVAAHAMHDLPLRKKSDGAILTHKHWESGKAGKRTRRKRPAPKQNTGRMMR
jgi:hypothetical protein